MDGGTSKSILIFLLTVLLLSFFVDMPYSEARSQHDDGKIVRSLREKLNETSSGSIRVIIKLKKASNQIQRSQARKSVRNGIASAGGRILREYSIFEGIAAEMPASKIYSLSNNPNIELIVEDRPVKAFLMESIPLIKADSVWNKIHAGYNITGKGQTICLVDTGVDYNHPALGGGKGAGFKVLGGYDFVNGDDDPMDDAGHGTHVAGILAANGSLKGVAPDASITAVKVLDSTGIGSGIDVLAGIEWCINNSAIYNISIISMSLGGGSYTSYCDNESSEIGYRDSINAALGKNISVIVATGNDANYTAIASPACIRNSTRVGATYDTNIGGVIWSSCTDSTTSADKITCFTNRGPNFSDLLLAPGALINSTVLSNSYNESGGTSMATPHVSGLFALLNQEYRLLFGRNPTPGYIFDVINSTGVSLYDSQTGKSYSRIDALAAYNAIRISPPVITITSPRNITYSTNSVELNFTASDPNGISWTGYSLDGAANVTSGNTTLAGLEEGTHQLTVYANDSLGNMNSSTVYFTIKLKIHNIDSGLNYSTIQEAINNASEGDTIVIDSGTFNENIVVNKSINIVGSGPESTIITAASSSKPVINISGMNGVNLSNLAVEGASMGNIGGIYLYNSNNSKIEYVNASLNSEGIRLLFSNNNTIANNTFQYNYGVGIHLQSNSHNRFNIIINNSASFNSIGTTGYGIFIGSYSDYNSIIENTANSQKTGIYVKTSHGNLIKNNTANSNQWDGIYVESSRNNTLIENVANSNTKSGIYLRFSHNTTLANNTAVGNGGSSYYAGILIWYSNKTTMTGNNLTNNNLNLVIDGNQEAHFNHSINTTNTINGKPVYYLKGILDATYNLGTQIGWFGCIGCDNITIRDHVFTNNSPGILFWNTNNSWILNITAKYNYNGLLLSYSYNNTINGSIFRDERNHGVSVMYGGGNSFNAVVSVNNYNDGINLDTAGNITIENSNLSNNVDSGIAAYRATYSNFTNNTYETNEYGVYLAESDYNNIIGGTIASNTYGVYLYDSGYNTLEEVLISGNTYGIFDESFVDSKDQNYSNNNITGGDICVYMYGGSGATFIHNRVWNCSNYSIYLETYTNGSIYNNIFNSSANAYDDGDNDWNTTKTQTKNIIGGKYIGGNVWAYPNGTGPSQTCIDLDLDSICDSNYSFTSAVDYLPLAIDTSPPRITNLSVSDQYPVVGSQVNITANVTDASFLDTVMAVVTYPNGTTAALEMAPGSLYHYSFNVSLYGEYNVSISANDTSGNTNSTGKISFYALHAGTNTTNIIKNTTARVIHIEGHLELYVTAKEDKNTALSLYVVVSPKGGAFGVNEINSSNSPVERPVKYVNASNFTAIENVSKITIRIYYKSSEISGLDEDTLSLLYWNGTKWLKTSSYVGGKIPGGPNVSAAGVNKSNNYVYADVDRLSIYGVGGKIFVQTQSPTPSGGGGGGGGGATCIARGLQTLDFNLLSCILKEKGLRYKMFYRVRDTLSSVLSIVGDILGEWPAPRLDVSSVLTKPITVLEGDVYQLAVSKVRKRWAFAQGVVIARGDIPVDSMAAVAYAKSNGYPILLTRPDTLPDEVFTGVAALNPSKIVIAGGPVAVSTVVENRLGGVASVERIWGLNREETAVRLAESLESSRVIDTIVVANGHDPSPEATIVAAGYKAPIVYVAGDTVPQVTRDFLEDHKVTKDAYKRKMKIVFVDISDAARAEIEALMGAQ